jgi:hypothetical protein
MLQLCMLVLGSRCSGEQSNIAMQCGATQPIATYFHLVKDLPHVYCACCAAACVQAELEDAHKADPVQPTLTPEEQVRCLAAACC